MRRILLVGSIVLALVLATVIFLLNRRPSDSARSEPPPLDISDGFGGTSVSGVSNTHRFKAVIRDADVAEHPIWDHSTENPPVSITDVMVAAQDYRDTLAANEQFPEWSRITEVKLVPIDSRDHLWFWVVTFCVEQIGNPIEQIEIAVLMDGSVVPHRIHRRIDTGWPPVSAPGTTSCRQS